ncbi:MAG TPA: ABC transporter permease [Flavobacteriales bacterium]|nr:ABC transporter permease [Flavobacteriales bacterium]
MWTLILNNLKLFFNDKKAVVLTFLLPIGLTSLFMFVFGGTSTGERGISEFELGVADLVQSNATQETILGLDSSKAYSVEMVEDSATLVDKVHKGKLKAGIIIFPGAGGDAAYTLVLDGAREVENAMLKPQLSFLLMGNNSKGMQDMIFEKVKKSFPGFGDSDRVMFDKSFETIGKDFSFEKITGASGLKTITLAPESGINPGAIQAVSGTALMTLLFAVAGMGAGIIEEKEKGTLRRILISPIRPLDFMFAKFFSSILIAFMQLSVTLIFCWLVFAFPIWNRPWELALLILFTAAAAASFGILLAGIADSRKQIESLSTIVVLLMSLLGGSMIPSFVMPPLMQKFSMLTINYWSGDGFFDLFYRDVEFSQFAIKLGVLLLFCIGLLSISIVLFRKKLARIA